jgi:hypothetical protein
MHTHATRSDSLRRFSSYLRLDVFVSS